jgi:hypothetical protein
MQPEGSMTLLPLDEEEISTIIKNLKNKSAPGHDGISPKTIKSLANKLVPLLVHLIR